MVKKLSLLAVMLAVLASPLKAQITVPNTLTAGQVIRAAELNTNFSTIADKALNRITGGSVEGNITVLTNVTIDGVDLSDFLLATGEVRSQTAGTAASPSFSRSGDTSTGVFFPGVSGELGFSLSGTSRMTLNASGLTVFGTNIIDATGKIPAISSTYFASLDGSNLTTLNASNVSSGTLADARLTSNVPLKDAANTLTVAGTALTVKPGSAPLANTKVIDFQQTGAGTTQFSVDYEGDTAVNSVTIASATGFKMGTSTTAGFVLTADASGNGTWQDASAASGNVPSGAILMFDAACPVTYTRVTAWDNKFIRGGATYDGLGGGSDTHTHTVDPASTASTADGSHSHTVDPISTATDSQGAHTHTTDSQGAHFHTAEVGSGTTGAGGGHSHTGTTDNGGDHNHAVTTTTFSAGGVSAVISLSSGGTHNHTFSTSAQANHTHTVSWPNTATAGAHTHTAGSAGAHTHNVDIASTTSSTAAAHSHSVDIASTSTSSGANVPAYVQVVFCKKD